MKHISQEDLELYCLGRATNAQLAPIEEHLLVCPQCVERAQAMLRYIDTLRAALRKIEEDDAPAGS